MRLVRTSCAASALLTFACGGPQSPVPPPAATAAPVASTAPTAKVEPKKETPAAPPFAEPESVGPHTFWVLGPFPVATSADQKAHPGMDKDYLAELGGESKARIDAATKLTVNGTVVTARPAELNDKGTIDLVKLFVDNTDNKVAYAYSEWTTNQPSKTLALFGSDDAAAIWLDGRSIHRVIENRAIVTDNDRFDLALPAGTHRLLVKVDNGSGGWGFALRLLDDEGRRRQAALLARRHLEAAEIGPESDVYTLDQTFPELGFRNGMAAERVFAKSAPRVRWFGPDQREAESPRENGEYIAVVEATTLDGYTYRRMLTFAKLPEPALRSFRTPPIGELPVLQIPGDPHATQETHYNDAQRAELSRHFWHGGANELWRGPYSAEAALAMARLGEHPPPKDEPLWLSSGFIQAAERRLTLRMALEGRAAKTLAPPAKVTPPAPELKTGTEAQAGMRPGTLEKVRAVARDWAKADKNGFVVLVARHGVVFMHEGFNGYRKDSGFRPASIAKMIAALTFGRAVDQGLVDLDQPVGSVLADWTNERTAKVTFRHCFLHLAGLSDHASHDGLFNAYLDNALFVEDAALTRPLAHFFYNGDDINLTGKALELLTGQTIWRLLYDNLQKPFGEAVTQFDLGFGDNFTVTYLAKIGQMILQDGRYGAYQFYKPGFLATLRPKPIREFAPDVQENKLEWGVGFAWMPDPPHDRQRAVLGPNVIGHGASSGTMFRIDKDHELVVVVGRNGFKDGQTNDTWEAKLAKALADGMTK